MPGNSSGKTPTPRVCGTCPDPHPPLCPRFPLAFQQGLFLAFTTCKTVWSDSCVQRFFLLSFYQSNRPIQDYYIVSGSPRCSPELVDKLTQTVPQTFPLRNLLFLPCVDAATQQRPFCPPPVSQRSVTCGDAPVLGSARPPHGPVLLATTSPSPTRHPRSAALARQSRPRPLHGCASPLFDPDVIRI